MNARASDDRPRRIYNPVQRDAATFLETSEETGGARTLAELEVAPGGKVTPHYHLTYSERFKVLEGQLTVEIDGIHHELEPGDEAVAEVRSLHACVIRARIAASSRSSFGPAVPASRTGFASPTGSRPTGSCARTACRATHCTRRWCSRWGRSACPEATQRSNDFWACWPASPLARRRP
jgi:quercetin dioxygenase-like cupin family protein